MFLLSKGSVLSVWGHVVGILSLHTGEENGKPVRVHLKLTTDDIPAKQWIVSLDKYEIKKLIKYAKDKGVIK